MASIRTECVALALVVLGLAASAPAPADEGEAPPGSSQEIFEALFQRVSEEVAAGRLEPGVGTAAEELRFELEKSLIASDAEIKIRRLEAGRFRGAEQQQALDRLIAATAAREQRVMAAVRRLERLAGAAVVEVPPAAAEASGEGTDEEGEEPPAEEETQERRFKITFEPEDLVDNPGS